MPRVRIKIPDSHLQAVATAAQEQGRSVDELYADAIARYVETNQKASPGSLRSRSGIPAAAPSFTIEIPEDLFQRADKLAKRLGKKRDVLYAEALARDLRLAGSEQSAFDQGHDLPSAALRQRKST